MIVTPPPHIKSSKTTSRIIWAEAAVLSPVLALSVYLLGLDAYNTILTSVFAAVATEAVVQKYIARGEVTLSDGSAVVTGMLLALLVPKNAPLWIPAVGTTFAIVVAKHVFGGYGSYVFNPALIGWAFLSVAWPSVMTTEYALPANSLSNMLLESRVGVMAEVSPLLIAALGLLLVSLRYFNWRIPAAYVGTVALAMLLTRGSFVALANTSVISLSAFFLATDTVPAPVTKLGRLVYGFGCGALTVIYSLWGNVLVGSFYSILLMNAISPFVERFTRPEAIGAILQLTGRLKGLRAVGGK